MTVCVSRNGFGDQRRVSVSEADYRTPRITSTAGGDRRELPTPALLVYCNPERIPAEWRSGRHAQRGPWPDCSGLLMIVEPDSTDPAVYAGLMEAAAEWRPRRRRRKRGEES